MKKTFLSIMMCLALGMAAKAQMMIDTWSFSTGVDTTLWMDLGEDYMTLIGTTGGSTTNYGNSGLRDIGFPFTLGATTHTKFSTNVNGTLRLGNTPMPSSSYIAEPLGQNINAGPRIDAFGRAAMFDPDCYMRSAVLGDSGSRVLVVETRLRDYGNWGAPEGNERYAMFQVQLFEAGGLRIVYGQADSGAIYGDMQNGVAATGNSSNKDVVFIDFATQRAVRFNGTCSLRNAAGDYPVRGRWYMLVPDPSACPLSPAMTPIATSAAAVMLPRAADDSNTYRVTMPVIGLDTVWPARQDTFALPPLNPATSYSLQLQTLCGSDTSYRRRSVDLFTGCGAVRHLPWGTEFTNLSYSDCWEMPYLSGNNADFNRRWRQTSTTSYVYTPSASGTYNSWLKFPIVYLPDADGITLKWDYKAMQLSGINPVVELHVAPCAEDGTVTDTAAWITLLTFTDEYPDYATLYTSLDTWRGQRVRVAFVRTGEGGGSAYIDNVMLYQQLEPLVEWEIPSLAYVGDTTTFAVRMLAGVDSNITYMWHSSLMDSTIVTIDSMVTIEYTLSGWDTVTIVTRNAYGSDTLTAVVDVLDCGTVTTFPWADDFSHNSACWTIDGWGRTGGNSVGGYDESGSYTSFTNVYYSNEVGGYMLTQTMAIPATGAEHLALWVQADGPLMVRVSTATDSLDTAYFADTLLTVPDNTSRKEIWWRTANLAAYAGQTVRFGFFRLSGTQPFLSAVRVDHDTLPVLSLLTAPTKTRTDSTISCSIELLRGASDGMTITWHSSLMDTSWIMNGANGFNRVSGFDVYYTVGGVDTITVVASNAFGSDTAVCTVQVVDCNPVTALPWHEGFDDGLDCWYRTESKTYHRWNHSYRDYYNYYAASQCNFSQSDTVAADAWLVSKAIDIPTDTTLDVRLFWSVGLSSGNNLTNVYRVMVTTGDFTDTTAYTVLYCDTTPLPNKSNLAHRSVSLSDYAGQTIYLAFRNQPVVRRATALIIDDVEVRATVMPRIAVTADATEYYYGDTATFTATLTEGSTNGLSYTWHSTLLDTSLTCSPSPDGEGSAVQWVYTIDGVDTITVIAANIYGSDTAWVSVTSFILTEPVIDDFTAVDKAFWVGIDNAEVGDTVTYLIVRNPCVTTGLTYHLHSTLLDTTVAVASIADTCRIPLVYTWEGFDTVTAVITNSLDTSDSYTIWLNVSNCPVTSVPFFEDFDVMSNAYADIPCWPGYYWRQPYGSDNNLGAGCRNIGNHTYLITPAIDLPADTLGLQLSWHTWFGSNYYAQLPAKVLVSPTGGKQIADFTDTLLFGNVPLEAYDTLSLDAYRGQRIRVAFGYTNYSLVFDNIRIDYDRSAPQVALAVPSTVYTHDSLVFTATLASGSPQGVSYTWHSTLLDSTIVTIEPIVTLLYPFAGTDTLTFVAANAYGSDTDTLVLPVVDHPLPQVTIAAPGTAEMGDTVNFSTTLNDCSSNGLTFTWHSTLLNSTWVVNGSDGNNGSYGSIVWYPYSGVDTVTVTVSNLYGSATDTAVVQVFDCSGASIPYFEDFEGVTATASNVQGNLPGCWSFSWNGSNAAYAPHVIANGGYQYISNLPSQALFMVAGSSTGYGNCAEVTLPRMADSLQTLSIAFDHRFEGASYGTLTVGYYNGNTFTSLQTMTPQSQTYRRDTVSLAAATVPDGRITLRWTHGSSWYSVVVDNIEVFNDLSPHAPTSVTVDSIGITYARVNWTPGANATAYRVVIDGVVDTVVSGLNVMLDGLAVRTQYTVRVASIARGDTSGYTSAQFITLCGPVTLPYSNNFSQGSASIDCWTQHNINVYMTDGCLAASSGLLARPSYICTPVMNHSGNGMVVDFRLRHSASTQDSVMLVVGAMTDPSDTTTFTAIDTFVVYDGNWTNCRFSTHALDTTPVAVAFCVGTGNDDFSSVRIDDLNIEEPIGCPQLLSADAISLGPTSARLSWQYDSFGATSPNNVLVTLVDLTADLTTTFIAHGTDTILNGLPLAHTFRADLRVLCSGDTSEAVSVSFTPEAFACVEITGNNAQFSPFDNSRSWGYSQMIYPASPVDTLYGIALYYTGFYGYGVERTFDVYIGQTTGNLLTSPISVNTHTLAVQNHSFVPASHGWIKIPFSTPVVLDGTSNIIVTIDDNSGVGGYNNMSFRAHSSEMGGCLYSSSSSYNDIDIDPTNVTSSIANSNLLPDIQLLGNCSSVDSVPACPAVSIPYVHDFTTGLAGCWIIPSNIVQTASSYDEGGARMDDGHTDHRYPLVSPEIDRDLNGLVVRYTVNSNSFFSPILMIGVCDDGGQNVVWLDTTIAAGGTHEYSYVFDNYTGTQRHICFFGGFISYLLDVHVDTLGECSPVSNLRLSHLADTSATVCWTPSAMPGEWAVYLNGILQDTTSDTLFHFSNLQPRTSYAASVRQICSLNDTAVAITTLFTTICTPQLLPYSENFTGEYNLDSMCWHTIIYPYSTFAQAYINGSDERDLYLVSYQHSDAPYDPDFRNYVMMPMIDPQGQGVDISFRANLFSYNPATSFIEVGIMYDAADTSAFVPIGTLTMAPSSSTFVDHQFIVPASSLPQPFCVAIRFGGDPIRCHIDDINITALTPTMHDLTLSVNDTTMGTVSGAGTYEEGTYVTFTATPNPGYHFVMWNDSVTTATRTVKMDFDTAFIAFFAPDTVGISEIENSKLRIEIYPNPSQGDVTIQSNQPATLLVLDMAGRVVIPPTALNSQLSILNSQLPSGTYFVRLTSEKCSVVKKLIIR